MTVVCTSALVVLVLCTLIPGVAAALPNFVLMMSDDTGWSVSSHQTIPIYVRKKGHNIPIIPCAASAHTDLRANLLLDHK